MNIEVFASVELNEFNEALYRLAQATGKEFSTVIRQNSRLICVNLALQTQPFGLGVPAKKQGEAAVARDIGKVYRTPRQIFDQIVTQSKNQKNGGLDAAKAFYKFIQTGQLDKAQAILHSLRIFDTNAAIGRFDPGAHSARKNRRGKVSGDRATLIVTDPKALKAYTKKIQGRVGTGKSGWASAASSIGGTRGIPGWVTRHQGGGHSIDKAGYANDPSVLLVNSIPYIDQILNEGQVNRALDLQRQKMMSHIEIVVAAEAKKAGLLATA